MHSDDTPPAGKRHDVTTTVPVVDAHERWQRTAVTAFFLAEARGFVPGHELEDWFSAERMVDAALIATAVAVDDSMTETSHEVEPVPDKPVRRARRSGAKPDPAGVEPAPKKKAATARKSTSRTRKSTPGIGDLGGMA